jgi:hypothetical protein|tara:strand:- start:5558 stop:5719 length:162 start_codon:yes stop_codon:yes gene_type:complete
LWEAEEGMGGEEDVEVVTVITAITAEVKNANATLTEGWTHITRNRWWRIHGGI